MANDNALPPKKDGSELAEIRSDWAWDDVTDEMRQTWVEIQGLADRTVRRRDPERVWRDEVFGKGGWRQCWWYAGRLIDRVEAIRLYEEAYVVWFRANADVLDWITSTASNVYDNAPSNVDCGFDYGIQETSACHLQDVSVRRTLARLGRTFQGDHLVEIRGHESEGYRLNPGQVPFHEPEQILPDEREHWWLPESTEAFWQHNKTLIVDPEGFNLRPILIGPEGLWCDFADKLAVLVPREGGRSLRCERLNHVRRFWSGVKKEERAHALVEAASWVPASQVINLTVCDVEKGEARRMEWSEVIQ